jgi:hypothetical protein
VVVVHHVVADLQVAQAGDERAEARARPALLELELGLGEELLLAVGDHPGARQPEAAGELARDQLDPASAERHLARRKQLLDPPAVGGRDHHHAALAARAGGRHLLREARQLAVEEVGRRGVEVDPLGALAGREHQIAQAQLGAGE